MEPVELRIDTGSKEDYFFVGENAKNVYDGINLAAIRGANWTTPIPLLNGHQFIIALDKIESMFVKMEDE